MRERKGQEARRNFSRWRQWITIKTLWKKSHDLRQSLINIVYLKESPKFDEDNLDIEWEGKLISAMDALNKSRKENKVLKEQLEAT